MILKKLRIEKSKNFIRKSILWILFKLFKTFRHFLSSQILKKSKKSIVAHRKFLRKTNRNVLRNVNEKTKFDPWKWNFLFENLFLFVNRRLRKSLRFSRDIINCNRNFNDDFANGKKFEIDNVQHRRFSEHLFARKKIRMSKN